MEAVTVNGTPLSDYSVIIDSHHHYPYMDIFAYATILDDGRLSLNCLDSEDAVKELRETDCWDYFCSGCDEPIGYCTCDGYDDDDDYDDCDWED